MAGGHSKPPGRGGGPDALAATRGVANVSHRRTWDKAEYEEAAAERAARDEVAAGETKAEARKRRRAGEFFVFFFRRRRRWRNANPALFFSHASHPHIHTSTERDPLQQGLIVERAALRARDFDLDLTSKAGSRMVVSAAAPKARQGGFYCAVCDCTLADSGSYLTHLNGRWHNRALGMSMAVERSTAADVRDRLAAAAARKKAKARGGGGGNGAAGSGGSGPDRGDELDRQLLLTAGPVGDDDEEDEEDDGEENGEGGGKGGPATAPPPPPSRPPQPPPAAEDDDGIDPDLAAAMGFAGFGTSAGR
jgi:U4/U6.U5 tri-snRNP component SNU23